MIEYRKSVVSVAVTDNLSTTPAIKFDAMQAQVLVTAAITLTFYACDTEGGTYRAVNRRTALDTDWSAWETATVDAGAAGVYPVPDMLCCPWVKVVGSASATIKLLLAGQ